jgi:RimJ/RimL family protein N-acetyltransferase/L-ascorbate metabolism protein UlaG (beta-lactamase superfamily)
MWPEAAARSTRWIRSRARPCAGELTGARAALALYGPVAGRAGARRWFRKAGRLMLGLKRRVRIETERMTLRLPTHGDWRQWVRACARQPRVSGAVGAGLVADHLSRKGLYQPGLLGAARRGAGHRRCPLFLIRREDQQLLGAITLDNIRRGPAQAGTFGYWIGQPFARQGYMREAILALVHHAFTRLDLSRLEAGLPAREHCASRGVLERCGFKYEGVAQSYLQINGRWRNHVLYANLRNDRRGRLEPDSVLIRYLDHASFAIVTADGTVAVTDYTGYLGTRDLVPDVVTMNNAHDTHWTAAPDPRIPHVLKGWPADGRPAEHRLDLGSMLVRNVTTDTRGPFGEGAMRDGNSIFIFEAGGLCIGHLGHLHQIPSEEQYAAIGRLDVVMVPVDGGYTMRLQDMAGVVRRLRSSVVIPMHWFSAESLQAFLAAMAPEFTVVETGGAQIALSLHDLPSQPTIMVLDPAWLD